MTDPLTPERLAEIEQRFASGRVVNVVTQRALLAEVRRLQAAVERVRALHVPATAPTSMHYYCETYDCDRAGEGELRDECQVCCEWHPCPTIAALDGDDQ